MVTKSIYCSKCRDLYGHHIARGKVDKDVYRNISVVGLNKNGTYVCKCKCGHTWKSISREAANLFKKGDHNHAI